MFLHQSLRNQTNIPSTKACTIFVMVNLGVEGFSNLKLQFTIYFDRWWRRLYPVWYGIGYGRFKLGDMEDGANGMHGLWEAECKREGAYLCDDSVGSQVLP